MVLLAASRALRLRKHARRVRDRRSPYTPPDYFECDLRGMPASLVATLCERTPRDGEAIRESLEALGVGPEEALHVGDNWLADIVGAKRAGLRAVWMRRWSAPEGFVPSPGDPRADAEITALGELLELLGEGA